MSIPENNIEDFSPSATLIPFLHPLPLLRGPIPAGLSDDPSLGPFVLAFKDDQSWKSSVQACESKIRDQCEGGALIGCSISASSKCKPPWWRTLFGGATIDYSERERCEELVMSACLAASLESCDRLAKDKCLIPFRDARISLIDQREASKFSCEVTNYRGNALFDSEK